MTPQELATSQREYLIRTEKESAVVILAEFETLKRNIGDYLTANLKGKISVPKLEENSFLEKILERINVEITRIKNPFTRVVTRGQQKVINFAARSLNEFLSTSVFSPDREAVQKLVGRTQNGTNLARFFERLNPFIRERAKETLIEGFASGESSAAIARRLSEVSDIARSRALTISRTEQNEAFRAAGRDFYKDAGITEYVWMSRLDARTCVICWSLHGRKFKSSKKVFSHPNCRCVILPKTKNAGKVTTGAEVFSKLEKGVQKEILGSKRFELFQAGAKFTQFVGSKSSKEFGELFFVKNLSDLSENI